MKKYVSLLLALILVFSVLPVTAFAFDPAEYYYIRQQGDKWFGGKPVVEGGIPYESDITKEYLAYLKSLKEDEKEKDKDNDDDAEPYLPHTAEDKIIGYGCDTKYHWKQCSCGCKIGMELHVDPKDAPDDTCICGYHFSDNADLVTLWVKGCPGIKYFDKNKTEYELDAYTYKDIKEIKISTRTHDSEATVELPEDLTLKEGQNKFEVKVTSENQKVTKIYTLIINKEAKK